MIKNKGNQIKRNLYIIIIIIGLIFSLVACIGENNFSDNTINNIIDNGISGNINSTDSNDNSSNSDLDIEYSEIDLENLFTPFWESYKHLHTYFIDQPIDNKILAEGALEGLNLYLEENNIILEDINISKDAPKAKDLSKEAKTPSKAKNDFLSYWELWQKILFVEFEDELAYELMMQYSLRFMAFSLDDPYTSYMDPVQYHENQEYLNPGDYEGIGAWVDISSDYITIISAMSGSPAEKADLRPNDKVIAIDGEDMTGVDGNLALKKILGPAGTLVTLRISREGKEAFDVEIIRANIETPSIRGEILDNDIAYIRIFSFSFNSAEEVTEMLESLLLKNPTGLILDLRYNPGGYVNQVIKITSEFLKDGVVLYEQYGDGSQDIYEVLPGGIATDIPMVVLVNEGSASASEILSGALQDYDRATIVGQTTFGKGSVLVNIPL